MIDLRHTVHEMKPLVLLLEGKQVISVCKVTLCFPSYTCSFIKIFRMTIKMAKHPITMTIMRMTSTPGTVRLCCCCYRYNSFFVFICFVCFFSQFILNSFLIPIEQITASNLRGFKSKLVCQFLYLFFVCLFVNSDMSIPEDIDEQLSSLNGYFTSDRTVSQASGEDLDFAEDILNF